MARKTKVFSEKKTEKDLKKLDKIPFRFRGEDFEAYGDVPGAVTLEFIEFSGSDEGADQAKSIRLYLERSMDKASYKRFKAIAYDPEQEVGIPELNEIVLYLIQERAERFTEASSASDANS